MGCAESSARGSVDHRTDLDFSLRRRTAARDALAAGNSGSRQDAVADGRYGHRLGMKVGYLKQLLREVSDFDWTTSDYVKHIVIPRTEETRCRFADLKEVREAGAVGDADAFASHCWQNRFSDLVAALAYVCSDEQFVWIDAFAVNQHPSTDEHLEDVGRFADSVRNCPALVLCAAHLESVAHMDVSDARMGKVHLVPENERRRCAFWRVWCLVELAAARAARKPVIMLVGKAGVDHSFVPESEMLFNMYRLVDIGDAEATFPDDVALILDTMLPQILTVDDRVAAA